MSKRKFLIFISLVLAVASLTWGVGQSAAQTDNQLRRQEAQDRLDKAIEARHKLDLTFPPLLPEYQIKNPASPLQVIGPNGAVNIHLPNYANSPNLRKFVNTLPGLGYAQRNEIGMYIPVAEADTTTYPGSDYYEIALREYKKQLHPDLPAAGTLLRGYAQINATDPNVQNVNNYLGPLIIAKS